MLSLNLFRLSLAFVTLLAVSVAFDFYFGVLQKNKKLEERLSQVSDRLEKVSAQQSRLVGQLERAHHASENLLEATFAKTKVKPKIAKSDVLSGYSFFPVIVDSDKPIEDRVAGTLDNIDYYQSVLAESMDEAISQIENKVEFLGSTPSIKPANGWYSSYFGRRSDPVTGKRRFHNGIDIAARVGTPVKAAADGVVIKSQRYGSYGWIVKIDHGNGFQTLYAHNRKVLVRKGAQVVKGQRIAKVGSTGRSTGSHLHFEVHHQGKPINPSKFIEISDSLRDVTLAER